MTEDHEIEAFDHLASSQLEAECAVSVVAAVELFAIREGPPIVHLDGIAVFGLWSLAGLNLFDGDHWPSLGSTLITSTSNTSVWLG